MFRVRIRLSRNELLRGLSHEQFLLEFHSAIGKSKLPVARGGRVDKPFRVTSGPCLPKGYTSLAEFFDLEFLEPILPNEITSELQDYLPIGCRIIWVKRIPHFFPHLRASIRAFCYTIFGKFPQEWSELFHKFSFLPYTREKHGQKRILDLRKYISFFRWEDAKICFCIEKSQEAVLSPDEVLTALCALTKVTPFPCWGERTSIRFLPTYFPKFLTME